jgi:hypothetical protein
MSKQEPPSDSIEVPIPGTGKSIRFTGTNVFFALLIIVVGYLLFDQLRGIHDEMEKRRSELHGALDTMRKEINCKLDLDIYMYGRPPETFQMRDMPRDLFRCLPEWVGKQWPTGEISPIVPKE